MSEATMKIGELARRSGVAATTIRFYESAGLLPAPARASGRRVYGPEALDALRSIRALQKAGFTLEEIRGFHALSRKGRSGARWQAIAHAKLRELDDSIRRLRAARRALAQALACECGGDVERCELVRATAPLDAPARRAGRRR